MKKKLICISAISLFFFFTIFQFSYNPKIDQKFNNAKTSLFANINLKHKMDIKISAYLDNMSPTKNSTINLTVNGPVGGNVTVMVHFKNNSIVISGAIGTDGIASIPIQVGNAEASFTVIVDVVVEHEGKTYKTNTTFTPR